MSAIQPAANGPRTVPVSTIVELMPMMVANDDEPK